MHVDEHGISHLFTDVPAKHSKYVFFTIANTKSLSCKKFLLQVAEFLMFCVLRFYDLNCQVFRALRGGCCRFQALSVVLKKS